MIMSKPDQHIDVNNILLDSVWENKIIIFAVALLLGGYYINDVIFTKQIAGVTTDVEGFMNQIDIKGLVIFVLPYLIGIVLFYISDILYARTMPRIRLDAINKVVNRLIESIRTSKKPINVNELILHIKNFSGTGKFYKVIATNILPTIVIMISLLYNVTLADTKSGLVVTIIIIMMVLVTFKLEYDNIKDTCEAEIASNELYDEIHDVLSNIDSIITSDTKELEMKNIKQVDDRTYRLTKDAKTYTANTLFFMRLTNVATVLAINYAAYRLYMNQKIGSEILVSNVLLSILFLKYYNSMLGSIKNAMSDTGRFVEIYDFFSAYVDINEDVNKIYKGPDLTVTRGDIMLRSITLGYGDNVIYKNFNYEFKGQSITGIIGEIGSGKSTLLKMLAGLIKHEGDVIVDNQYLKQRNYKSIVRNIAYISQHPVLFNKSILYNLRYGTKRSRAHIEGLLKDLGLYEFFQDFPEGLDTKVGKRGDMLSGGQKQFVAIIRALLQNKNILLLDEPSSSLDKNNKQIFMNLLKKLKDKTIIVTTHDKQLFPVFDKVIDIDHVKKLNPKP